MPPGNGQDVTSKLVLWIISSGVAALVAVVLFLGRIVFTSQQTQFGNISEAFKQWATVVDTRSASIENKLDSIRRDQVETTRQLTRVMTEMLDVIDDLEKHQTRPWHDEAGIQMQRQSAELARIRDRVDDLRQRLVIHAERINSIDTNGPGGP